MAELPRNLRELVAAGGVEALVQAAGGRAMGAEREFWLPVLERYKLPEDADIFDPLILRGYIASLRLQLGIKPDLATVRAQTRERVRRYRQKYNHWDDKRHRSMCADIKKAIDLGDKALIKQFKAEGKRHRPDVLTAIDINTDIIKAHNSRFQDKYANVKYLAKTGKLEIYDDNGDEYVVYDDERFYLDENRAKALVEQ